MEETAIDTGGPSREFWRLFVQDVVQDYCVGDVGISLFVKNVPAMRVCFFCCVRVCKERF